MRFNYQLTNKDYFVHQLYITSKLKSHSSNYLKIRIIYALLYIVIGFIIEYIEHAKGIGLAFTFLGILWFFIYPYFQKWKTKNILRIHVEENYKDRVNKEISFEVSDNSILANDSSIELNIKGIEITDLIEIKTYFFINLKNKMSFIIPKNAINDSREFKNIMIHMGANYIDDTKWNW